MLFPTMSFLKQKENVICHQFKKRSALLVERLVYVSIMFIENGVMKSMSYVKAIQLSFIS